MTRIEFFTENGLLSGVRVRGHSGYAEEGEDVVCAAISSALRLAECELTDVLKLDTNVSVKKNGADITVKVRGDLIKAQSSLTALRMHYTELATEFPKNIKLLEV
jgi:uncharacterized protein YsxB (DUF464 family)